MGGGGGGGGGGEGAENGNVRSGSDAILLSSNMCLLGSAL